MRPSWAPRPSAGAMLVALAMTSLYAVGCCGEAGEDPKTAVLNLFAQDERLRETAASRLECGAVANYDKWRAAVTSQGMLACRVAAADEREDSGGNPLVVVRCRSGEELHFHLLRVKRIACGSASRGLAIVNVLSTSTMKDPPFSLPPGDAAAVEAVRQ